MQHAPSPQAASTTLFSRERRRRRLMEFLKAFDGRAGPASVSLLAAVAPEARRQPRQELASATLPRSE